MNFVAQYLAEAATVAARIDHDAVTSLVELLADARDGGGRLFVLGVGGSAGNASHAVNDFRKIAAFEAYAPTDNVSELTARINDEGGTPPSPTGSRRAGSARATACSSSRWAGATWFAR